eukprot:TRINITY_DN9475_c0_g1_i1.p1 TRINITY_DN9475_c0_g1~~TRINITY_DN9475_c0_g1_i1.p1  ORF type:complete len:311 (-),score=109.88 TRINITY_DN9475_c0_g1_i1:29-961(-)
MALNPIHETLHSITCDELVDGQPDIISLKENDTVEEGLKLLSDNKILSLPVLDEENNLVGLLDILDIASYIAKITPEDVIVKGDELNSLNIAGKAIGVELVKNVMGQSGRDNVVPIFHSNKVSMAVDVLGKGVHRVPLFCSETNEIKHSLSQSDVIKFLEEHIKRGGNKLMADITAIQMGMIKENVISCNESDSVLDCVSKFPENGISALAVVSDEGKLVGNFSASDLKCLSQESFPDLLLSVHDFLEKHSPNSLNPVVVKSDATLENIIAEVTSNHIHRVFILNNDYLPIGICALTDILNFITSYECQY